MNPRGLLALVLAVLLVGSAAVVAAPPASATTGAALTGLTLSADGTALALDPAFSSGTTSYNAKVLSTATSVTVTPSWTGGHTVFWKAQGNPSDTKIGEGVFSGSGASQSVTLSTTEATTLLIIVNSADFLSVSVYSVVITPVQPLPDAPVGLKLVSGDAELRASWSAPVNTGATEIIRYEVQRKRVSDAVWPASDTDVSGLTATVGGLANDVAYRVRVRAVNSAGAGPWSTEAVGTPSVENQPTSVTLSTGTGTTLSPGIPFSLIATLDRPALTDTHCVISYSVVHYSVQRGTDTRTLVIAAGQTSAEIALRVLGPPRDAYLIYTVECADLSLSDTERLTVSHRRVVSVIATVGVAEGDTVKVKAVLTAALASDVTIPLTVTAGTAESGDYVAPSPATVTIKAGKIIGETTITTVRDDDDDDETFTVALGSPLPSGLLRGSQAYPTQRAEEIFSPYYEDYPESQTVEIWDRDRDPTGLDLSVESGDGALALTWNKPVGPNTAYEVNWKASSAPDADATAPGDPSTGWVAPRALINGSTWVTEYLYRTEYTVGGLVNGTAYDVRVRQFSGGQAASRWSTGAGTSAAPPPPPPPALTLGVAPGAIAHGGSVTVTARLDRPALTLTEVWFDTSGDGGGARWGPDCAWEHGTAGMIAPGGQETTVKLCATAAAAGRTMTVTAGFSGPYVVKAGVKVRVLGPNPPTALTLSVEPQDAAAGGAVTITARLDRPTAPGITVHLSINGVGAAYWGDCLPAGTALSAARLYGRHNLAIPPGQQQATAQLCLRLDVEHLSIGAWTDAPRLSAQELKLMGPAGLSLRSLTVNPADPSQSLPTSDVDISSPSDSFGLRVPRDVTRITVKPATVYSAATAKVNGKPLDTDSAAVDVPLEIGDNVITVEVDAPKAPAPREYTLTVTRGDASTDREPRRVERPRQDQQPRQQQQQQPELPECEPDSGPLCGIALSAGSQAVALSPDFAPDTTSYRAAVPAGTTSVTLTPVFADGTSVFGGSRWGAATYTRPTRIRPSGTPVELALAPDGGPTELWFMVTISGKRTNYRIDITQTPPQPQPQGDPPPDQGDPPPQQDDPPLQELDPPPQEPDPQQPEPEREPQAQQSESPPELPGPGPVTGLQLAAGKKSVTVTWQAPQSGGAPDRYIVHIKPVGGGDGTTHRPKAGKLTTTFRNLEPGTAYKVWVRAQNDAGKGERVHATVTLPPLLGPE
ncbi:fibronectin type III domain-containing protein [Candidatus Poriferisodalis sp.]|uniref:fibronectin type III domain-containing protein n=1 Tax=Candidatus Poriferisodalis sp. TaxID=3101277 RepID=UPI003B02D3C4